MHTASGITGKVGAKIQAGTKIPLGSGILA